MVEKVQLHEALQSAFRLFEPRVASSNLSYSIHIDAAVPQWVLTDKHRLAQVLVNLLGNAIKFTESGFVQLKASVVFEGEVEVSIEDSGIGISQDDQARLFERFPRLIPVFKGVLADLVWACSSLNSWCTCSAEPWVFTASQR
jgi:signal transduction histidine kinase